MLLKDAEILKEKAQLERQAVLNRVYLIVILFVLILSIVIYIAYRQKQKDNYNLDARNREVEIAYKTLAVSENKFKQITETINDVFYLYNIKEKRYEYISPNCYELLGLKASFFYEGKSMKVIVHEEDLQAVIDANILIDSGIPYNIQYRIIHNGEIKWVAEKSSPIFDEKGELVRNSGICRDITSPKRNEELLRKKNRDITNSINYARNIQQALEVPLETIKKGLKEVFIYAQPKEIVSGDFYFYKETQTAYFIAAVDCTGHGVPAGFLSMIGNSFLEDIVKFSKDYSPADVLDKLRDKLITSLHQDNPNTETKDGMDIALLKLDKQLKCVQFAGAFNPLYVIRNQTLQEVAADTFTVGLKFGQETKPFSNHVLELKAADSLYIMSDGYISQFGGPDDRKFSKKRMQELLLKINAESMDKQKELLHQQFENWKGKSAQVDDVLVIGIKV
ncbi:MAG TPA: SpoIIE family protein phosphatase [Bacteroidia bacterium]|nr:SpoIIE family protein phosphatase [Bacteroidia bacterium]